MPNPALDDVAGWKAMIEQTDAMVADMLGGTVLPMTSQLRQIGGVATYVVTADGDHDPVLLSIHGSALIMGAGDLTRVMTEISALSAPVVHWALDNRMPPTRTRTQQLWTTLRLEHPDRDEAKTTSGSIATASINVAPCRVQASPTPADPNHGRPRP